MLRFPKIPDLPDPPQKRMSLGEYAHFSELCLTSNPHITPENCLTTNNREAYIKKPFKIPPESSTTSAL